MPAYLRPSGYSAVTPWLVSRDTAKLIEFVAEAFGGVELGRVLNSEGRIGHAEVRIEDSIVMLFDTPRGWPTTPAFLRLFVSDAKETHQRALRAGATNLTDVTRLAFGDLVGRVEDFAGNVWWLQTHVEDVAQEELSKRWADPTWLNAMKYVQSTLTEHKFGV